MSNIRHVLKLNLFSVEELINAMEGQKKRQFKIKIGIGVKLISILGLLIVTSILAVTYIATSLSTQFNTALVQQMTSDTAIGLGASMRSYLESTTDKIFVLGKALDESKKANPNVKAKSALEKAKDLVRVGVNQWNPTEEKFIETVADIASDQYAEVPTYYNQNLVELWKSGVNEGLIRAAPVQYKGEVLILVLMPYLQIDGGHTWVISAWLKPDVLVHGLSQFENYTSYIIDKKGVLVVHPDLSRIKLKESKNYLPIVEKALEGKQSNGQMSFWDSQLEEKQLGAFSSVGFSGWTVVTQVQEDLAVATSKKVQNLSVFVSIIVMAVAFLIGYFYSESITWPIELLSVAAAQISKGNFKINLKTRSRDELGHLALSFNQMAKDLEHREKVVSTFHKFHNKEIADKLLNGEVKLGGERKQSVVFFSDLRGFTAMSETMEPEQVVEVLNNYLSRMVNIVRSNKGVVDKFIGDAIMALWGVPEEHSDDAENAVRACLEMRMELARMNEERKQQGLNPLKIGIGLHVGPLIAGNIGSSEKMEYTVIGDTVNLASRIEALTKHYGTDLLISDTVAESIKDKFVLESCDSAQVKGKSSSVVVFKVRGVKNADGTETLMETEYSEYASEKSDKVLSAVADFKKDAA